MAARGSGDHHCATGARSSLPAASVPTKGPVSSVLGAAPRGATEPSPCLGTVLPPRWAFSHRALLVFQPAPGEVHHSPPQLPSPAPPPAFPPADSPRAGPATNLVSSIWCHHRARVHGVGGCSGRGSVLREILIFHGCFCPPGTFLAAFPPTPRVSAAGLCCPHGGSIPSHGLSSQRRILGSTVTHGRHLHSHLPLLAPKALSHVSAAGGYLCPSVPAPVLSRLAPALYIALQWPPQPPKR